MISFDSNKKRRFFPIISHFIFFTAWMCLLSILFLMCFPAKGYAFDKKEIKFLDLIKTFEHNISLQFPIDVYTGENGDIYILDSGLQMILIFDKNFLPLSVINKANGLKNPISLAVDKGMIYVSEETPDEKAKGRIAIFDSLSRRRKILKYADFPEAESFVARDMAMDKEGNLYLAGGTSGLLVILSKEGRFIRGIQCVEKDQSGAEKKTDVSRVALKSDHIYLLSEWQGHVYMYDRQGNRLNVFGQKGGSPKKLSRAQGLAVDPTEGVTYVMDYMRHTLLMFDISGRFMNEFGGKGWGPGWFNYPKDICIDTQGRLFVADTFNKRVQVFQTRL